MSNVDVMKQRISVRTYSDRKIEPGKIEQLTEFININSVGPFGSEVRMLIADVSGESKEKMRQYGTYGIIKGTSTYLMGILKKGAPFEDFGYVFERVILKATELGLGTCWLGGTFKRSGFSRAAGLEEDENLCAISPLGYPAPKQRFAEKTMRSFAGSAKRLPFECLFFRNPELTPLGREEAGTMGKVLEYVRIGPSASNKQPWRIVVAGNTCHFYLTRTRGYKRNVEAVGGADLQRSDIGIAMCHFEQAVTAIDPGWAAGKWVKEDPGLPGSFEYVASWRL